MYKKISLTLATILSLSLPAYADNEDRRVFVHNLSSKRIVKMYASPIDQKDWKYNMLNSPSKWIRVGEVKFVDINDGTGYCRYDILMVRADGQTYTNFNVNVCKLGHLYVNDPPKNK